ncbi:hypothetical protein MNB_SM-7-1326 [hydrothermal vent metagenome]|uniref:Uncharacterized protein n=1 Tax=hydrothermal vent metagenome TaxID=652676 RepID=A0A1W1BXX6_9ZZZZ
MSIDEALSTVENEVLAVATLAKVLKLATIAPDYTNHTLELSEVDVVADLIHSLASDTAMKIADITSIKG